MWAVILQSLEAQRLRKGGNDNTTLNGEVEVTGTESSVFTADFKDLEPALARAIKDLKCESLKVFFVNDAGDIIGVENEAGTTFDGLTVNGKSFFLSDRNNNGIRTERCKHVVF